MMPDLGIFPRLASLSSEALAIDISIGLIYRKTSSDAMDVFTTLYALVGQQEKNDGFNPIFKSITYW